MNCREKTLINCRIIPMDICHIVLRILSHIFFIITCFYLTTSMNSLVCGQIGFVCKGWWALITFVCFSPVFVFQSEIQTFFTSVNLFMSKQISTLNKIRWTLITFKWFFALICTYFIVSKANWPVWILLWEINVDRRRKACH